MASAALAPVEPGEYLTPAGRMARIGETRAVLGDRALFDPLGFWLEQGVLGIPGLDDMPAWRPGGRSYARYANGV